MRSVVTLLTAVVATLALALTGTALAAGNSSAGSTVCGPTNCPDNSSQTLQFSLPPLYQDGVLASTKGVSTHGLNLYTNKFAKQALKKLSAPIVGVAAAYTGRGYYLVERNGQVIGIGAAKSFKPIRNLPAPIVGIAASPVTRGIWLLDADGNVYARDTAKSYGSAVSTGATTTSAVGISPTQDGKGYFIAERNGHVINLGDAKVAEPDSKKIATPVVGIAGDPTGSGYWLVSSNGTVTAAGTAKRFPLSAGKTAAYGGTAQALVASADARKAAKASPVVGIAATRDGQGYFVVHANSQVVGYGNAVPASVSAGKPSGFVGIAANPTEKGLAPVKAASTNLDIVVGDVPKGVHGALTVTGPHGFDRHIAGTHTFTHVAPGKYKIIAAPVKDKQSQLTTEWRTTVAVLKHGAQARVSLPYDEELSPLARSLTPSAVISVAEPQTGSYVVRASDPTKGLAQGDVVAVGAGKNTPEGLLLKLGHLTHSGAIDTFDATRASLTDLAPTGAFQLQNVQLSMPSGSESSKVGDIRSHDIFSNSSLSYDQDVTCSGSSSVEPISGGLTFQPSFDFAASWGGLFHPLTLDAAFDVGATENFNYTATFTGSESCQYQKDLLKDPIKLGTIEFSIDGFPIIITPQLNFSFQASGSVTGSSTMSVSEAASQDVGLEYNGSLSPIHDFSSDFSLLPQSASANATFQVGIDPQLTFGLEDTDTGPFIGAYGYLQYDIGTGNPWWDLQLGLQPNAGLQVSAFDHTWSWTYNWSPWTTTLAQATTPIPPTVTTASLPSGTVGTLYSTKLASSGGAAPVTFAPSGNLPPGVGFNPSTGQISGTPSAAGTYTFTVQPYDNDGQLGNSKSFTITIAAPPLNATATTLPGGIVGTPYSAQLAATGGIQPYTWTVSSGSLPAGMTLSSAGKLSGTPTATHSGNVTFQVKDSADQTATVTSALNVVPAPLVISTNTLPVADAALAYSQELQATGGTPPYTWSVTAGTLPPGLTLDPTTGTIAGTPTASGGGDVTFEVTDAAGKTATATLSVTSVVPAPLAISTTSLPPGTAGTPYSTTLQATGGAGTDTWSVTSGTLPDGLSLNPTTGAITGTPTDDGIGDTSLTFEATDQIGDTTTVQLPLSVVAAPLVLVTTSLPSGELEASYDVHLSASGGVGPYSWALTSGSSLPEGLSLNAATGEITGTPVENGDFSFTVQVSDSQSSAATANASFTVHITSPSDLLPNGVGTFAGDTEPAGAWDTSFSGVLNDACLTAGTDANNNSSNSSIVGCEFGMPDAGGSGALQLTNTEANSQVGAVFYNGAIPTSAGLDVTFNTYQYDTDPDLDNFNTPCDPADLTYPACSGADGIAFSLAAVNPATGALPGSLGHPGATLGYSANSADNGLADGYLGIGFDAFGNFGDFSLSTSLTSGCSAPGDLDPTSAYAEAVTVHGPGNGQTGYCILNSTAEQVNVGGNPGSLSGFPASGGWDLNPGDANNPSATGLTTPGQGGLDSPTAAPAIGQPESSARSAVVVPAEVIINPESNGETVQSTDDNGAFTVPSGDWAVIYQAIDGSWQKLQGTLPTVTAGDPYPSSWIDPTTGLPYEITFGWTSSTGAVTELHEVNDAEVHTPTPVPSGCDPVVRQGRLSPHC